tara:strand:- start:268 stop:666 length:399 start_codon:yes stop_codon:yes gene_type:complete
MKKQKDFNYIAKLEKAIKKKYGDSAIQNPANLWNEEKEKDYLNQLKEFLEKEKKHQASSEPENVNGILITRKLFNRDRKLNCSVCEKKINSSIDDICVIKYDCCGKCYINFIEGREDRWLEGWRPDNVKKST